MKMFTSCYLLFLYIQDHHNHNTFFGLKRFSSTSRRFLSISFIFGAKRFFSFAISYRFLLISFIFDLENACLNSLNSFLIFSILGLEKLIFGFVSSKFFSPSFNDSDALKAINSLSSEMLL